jgi:hypothetical protein
LAINVPSDGGSSDEESLSPNNAQGTQRSVLFEIESLNLALKDVRTTCRGVKPGEKISRESWYDIISFYVALESRYLRTVMEARGAHEPKNSPVVKRTTVMMTTGQSDTMPVRRRS